MRVGCATLTAFKVCYRFAVRRRELLVQEKFPNVRQNLGYGLGFRKQFEKDRFHAMEAVLGLVEDNRTRIVDEFT